MSRATDAARADQPVRERHFLLGVKIGGRATVEGWESGLTQRSWR